MSERLLTLDRLDTTFDTDEGTVKAVNDVSLVIPRGRTLGLVGESGCGKSVTALSIMRLIAPPGRIAAGRIWLHGDGPPLDLAALPEPEMREIRGGSLRMIFQEPMTSLNPVFTVGAQIVEASRCISRSAGREARDRAVEMLRGADSRAGSSGSPSIRTSSPAACGSGR